MCSRNLKYNKQYSGLTYCQSRQKVALAFHFNISLTAINMASNLYINGFIELLYFSAAMRRSYSQYYKLL